MTVVEELRANFSATFGGMTRGIREVRKEIQGIGDTTASATGKANRLLGSHQTAWQKMNATLNNVKSRYQSVQNAGGTMMRVFSVATAAVGGSLGLAAKSAIDFESKMSDVKSVMDPSDARKYGKELENLAIIQGSKTAFSATQAAEAEAELVKAGVSVSDIMHGALTGSLNLAVAGQLNLKDAAEIASTALNAFRRDGLSVAKAADILAGAANASATDVGELKLGLSQVSPVAAGVGWSFKDTVTALAEFSQYGLKGSDAGTSLKTMLQNLQPQTKAQTEQFKKLGIITKDGNNQFIDAQGHFKGLSDVAGVLRKSMSGLTDAQRSAALEIMFGSDAVRAGNVLYQAGAKGIDNMVTSMDKIKAADVARQRMNNMKGTLEQLRGSLETAGITIGRALIPTLQDLSKKIQGAVDWFNNLSPEMQQFIAKSAATAAAVLAVGTGFSAMTWAIGGSVKSIVSVISIGGRLIKTLRGVGAAAGAATAASAAGGLAGTASKAGLLASVLPMLTNPIGLTVAGLAAVGTVGYIAWKQSQKLADTSLKTADAMGEQHNEISSLIGNYDGLRNKSKLSNDEFARFIDIQSELKKASSKEEINALQSEAEKLQKKSGLSNEQLQKMIDLNGELVKKVPGATDKITDQGNAIVENTKNAKRYNAELLNRQVTEMQAKRAAAISNEGKLRDRIAKNQVQINENRKEENRLQEIANYLTTHSAEETARKYGIGIQGQRDVLRLTKDHGQKLYENLAALQKQDVTLIQQNGKYNNQLGLAQRILEKIRQIYMQTTDTILSENKVNHAKGEGIVAVTRQIEKEKQKKAELDQQLAAGKIGISQYNQGRSAIQGQIDKLIGVGKKIGDATEQSQHMNKVLREAIHKDIHFNGNPQHDAIVLNNTLSATKDKRVNVNVGIPAHSQRNMYNALNHSVWKDVNVRVNRPAGYFDLGKSVYKDMYVRVHQQKLRNALYANGTEDHPGGPAVLGDAHKEEPYLLPDGTLGISPDQPTLFSWLPKGTRVWSSIQKFISQLPHYADGTRGLLNGLSDQLNGMMNPTMVIDVENQSSSYSPQLIGLYNGGGRSTNAHQELAQSHEQSLNRVENLLEKLVNSRQVVVLDTGALVGGTYAEYDRAGGNRLALSERWGL